jgi:hypothetical protein
MPRAQNPTFGASLLDKSTAKPGSIDMSIFEKKAKLGEGQTSSDYLAKTRQEDPWPPDDGKKNYSIELSDCKFLTAPDAFAIGKDFEAECQVKTLGNYNPTNLRTDFIIKTKYEVNGVSTEESTPDQFSAYLKFSEKSQTVKISGKVPSPVSSPPTGTKVQFFIEAKHSEAEKTSLSTPIALTRITTSDGVSIGGEAFLDDGHVPVLDTSGTLILGLAQIFDMAKKTGKGSWIVFGHKAAGEKDEDGTVTADRANLIAMLLKQDASKFGQLANKVASVAELQTILSVLTSTHSWICDPGTIDGISGRKTRAAIRSFQESAPEIGVSLKIDGIIGPKTWAGIGSAILDLVQATLFGENSKEKLPQLSFGYAKGDGAWACEDPSGPGSGGCWATKGVDVMFFAEGDHTPLTEAEE